jgi:predicted Zn-dependent protease
MMQSWRKSFEKDATQAVADLFSGRAGIAANFRRDVPEILFHEFPDIPAFTADREKLENALVRWLENMRRDYTAQIKRLGYAVYAQRICDALRALQLLDFPRCIYHLREVHQAWLRWLEPLRLAPERDPALESWRLISQHQPATASSAPWLKLAADSRPEYLAVALLGLERQPLGNIKNNQTLMLAALVQHCANNDNPEQAAAEFNRRYISLRGRYPRGPEHWRQRLDATLKALTTHQSPSKLQRLITQLESAQPRQTRKKQDSIPSGPSLDEKNRLLELIRDTNESTSRIESEFTDIINRLVAYTRQTGDSYFFVRTLCNHGNFLLDRPDLSKEIIDHLRGWIEESLRWESRNPHVWMFWGDWLAWQNRLTHREWVLREAIRLFPDNEPCPVELARLLIEKGSEHWPEAEHLLRETADRHPTHLHSRVELARLLISKGRDYWQEAEDWLRKTAKIDLSHTYSRLHLARLLIRRDKTRWPEAEIWLQELTRLFSDDEQGLISVAKLFVALGKSEEGRKILREFLRRDPENIQCKHALHQLEAGEFDFQIDGSENLEVISRSFISNANSDEAAKANTSPAPNCSAIENFLIQLGRRSEIQILFTAAKNSNQQAAREELRVAADAGDTLAGFFAEWLGEPMELPPPPNAWAWRAARCYRSGKESDWLEINKKFPDFFDLNQYLKWLSPPYSHDDKLKTQLDHRFAKLDEIDSLSPAQLFAWRTWKHFDDVETQTEFKREGIALSLMQAEAEPAVIL